MNKNSDKNNIKIKAKNTSLGIDWYGQTTASICWIASVFAYGIDDTADLLQLFAGSAWLIANIYTAVKLKK